MRCVNETTLLGRLAKDPELRKTRAGVDVCDFTVVTNETWFNETTGKQESKAFFMPVVAWRHLATLVSDRCIKGDIIYVKGKLEKETWISKVDNEKRSKISLTAENITVLGRGADNIEYEDDGLENLDESSDG